MRHSKTNSDVKKRGQRNVPARANLQHSANGRLPGHNHKASPAVGKNNPAIVPPNTQLADRSSPGIRPNIERMGSANLDQPIAKAKSQMAHSHATRPERLSYHPACLLFPSPSQAELQELADDIKARGLQNPVVQYRGQILDGKSRIAACEIAGVEPTFREWNGKGSPTEWVVRENLIRRHLTSSQKAVIAHDLLPILEQEAKERQRLSRGRGKKVRKDFPTFPEDGRASQIAARVARTNAAYVKAVKAVQKQAPELVEQVRSGKITVPEARELARSTQSIRKKVLGTVNGGGPKKKVSRLIREATISARKASARRYASTNGAASDQDILHGDMKLLWERLDDGSVRMFLTDPPYAEVDLYGRLAELAAAKLVAGGLCLAYCDPGRLPEVFDVMRRHLGFWWCFGVSHTGKPRYVNDRHIQNKWKPIVAFGRAPVRLPPEWLGDFIVGGGRDKEHHRWGQPESEAKYLITRLTEAGDLVVEPFCGGGTIPVACKALGRRWLATEIDGGTVAIARKRLADSGR